LKVVEFGEQRKQEEEALSWLQEAKEKKRSKMKRERRRGGIYRNWIVKGCN